MSKVVYEGWMVRYGRRKIGRSFIHMRYFVLENRLLAYYKRKPQVNQVPIKTLLIDGNCRVEDRGLKTQHGHMVYVLSVYNKKEKYNRITMAAFNIQEALMWKEKIESVIDQHQDSQTANCNKYVSFEYKSGMDNGRNASSSDHESQFSAQEDEDDAPPKTLLRRTTIGNGPPDSILDWTQEFDSELSNQNANNQAFSRKHWRLLQCQNGLRIFEELLEVDYLPRSCSRAMKAVGVVEASCEEIFGLVMSMDGTRFEWDCSFQYGSLVEEVDGHTAIIYHRLQLDWFTMFVWPRDLCYVRYWRRNDDGSYVVLFRSREHENCGPQPGYVRAHVESGGFNISPLKSRNGKPRTQVQHLMQIDLKGWGVNCISSFQQYCLLQMLNSVAGLREWFAQTDERGAPPRIPVMVNMASASVSLKKTQKIDELSVPSAPSLDQMTAASRNSLLMDEYSDEDEEQMLEAEQEAYPTKSDYDVKRTALEEEPIETIDLSCFSGNLRQDDRDNSRDCWRISDGNNFRVRSKQFCYNKTKIPAGKHLMDLVAVDWFKDTKRIDHVARRQGCAAQVASEKGLFSFVFNVQVPGSTHYSMVFYFVTRELVSGSLLQRFVDGDDEFHNSRLKLIPSVPKEATMKLEAMKCLVTILKSMVDWMNKQLHNLDPYFSKRFETVQNSAEVGSIPMAIVSGDEPAEGSDSHSEASNEASDIPKEESTKPSVTEVDTKEVENNGFLVVKDNGSNGDDMEVVIFGTEELFNQWGSWSRNGSWIVRQSVGSTPCLLGKAVDCNYIRGPKYLEVDIDIGSSTVANGVLGLVIGVIRTLVVDMAFLVQANTTDELPERLIGAVRVSHIELSSAIVPKLDVDTL